jgi:signal transduction histidine kinase
MPTVEPNKNSDHTPLRSDLKRIAQMMYTQNLTLLQNNRTLSILREIDLLILESNRNLKELASDISKAIISSSSFSVVGLLSLNYHGDTCLNFQGWWLSDNLAKKLPRDGSVNNIYNLKLPIENSWLNSKKRSFIVDLEDVNVHKYSWQNQEQVIKINYLLSTVLGIKSIYLTKLKARGDLTGIIVVGFEDTMPHIDDIELVERISEPTGIALYNRLLFEENQTVVRQLQQTNEKLKEIDETKDEFISMASHQLRTPLTSMKGYVSMVLEGDVGPITDSQRKMLSQAFNSSQRMVYLIADLLNVSRLRTGKFVINNKETDLAQVVESELSQLYEAAVARNVKFFYNKPSNFPKLMLDETKIRQVVMNFIDNALYYTPKGGRVSVELKSNDKIIEYTVTDTGLGVPKDEQPHLFSKFYRAQNARKMRPDGTGLGLYMSKKIITAQGGSIIFSSIEGEGSTFGFRFPRDDIAIK